MVLHSTPAATALVTAGRTLSLSGLCLDGGPVAGAAGREDGSMSR